MPVLPPNTTRSQANPLQGYAVTPTEGSNIDWSPHPHVGGPVATSNVHGSSHEYNAPQDVPTLQAAIPGFPALPAPTCGLAGGLPCALQLEGSVKSINLHLRRHCHRYPQRHVVQCPFTGCSDTLQWINIPRHIKSIHLGVRFRCPNCDKPYTRPKGLATHIASQKCHGTTHVA
ncbi:hypothetical protein OG21DRAFT_790166 [Imleria badia]|nr:hypothetical protein OG21DRAFT_790166 [Imleria badia]